MKVNYSNKNSVSFNGFYNNKFLKKGLNFAEKNGALFASATSLALSSTLRPGLTLLTPKTDKENKKLACAKAVTSTLLEFILTLVISAPIVKSVGKISKQPEKYLKKKTIDKLKENSENLKDSDAYTFANQLFKLGIGVAIAAPKAILNVMGMPYISTLLFGSNKNENSIIHDKQSSLTFKGKEKNKLASVIAKLIDNKQIQDFSLSNAKSNFPMHINAIKDGLTTSVFIGGVINSKKIDTERKKPLIYNSAIATGLSIISGYVVDTLTKKSGEKFLKRFCEANKDDPKLKNYTDGFKIAKPVLILGIMYYGIIPVISTFYGERVCKNNNKTEF